MPAPCPVCPVCAERRRRFADERRLARQRRSHPDSPLVVDDPERE